MNIDIWYFGRKPSSELSVLIQDYEKRLSKYLKINWISLPKLTESDPFKLKNAETELVLQKIKPNLKLFVLTENGKPYTSQNFSELLENNLNSSMNKIIFLIGGSYGVNENLIPASATLISLSSLTFPHQLVKLILIEQIYRSMMILKGSPYHHE